VVLHLKEKQLRQCYFSSILLTFTLQKGHRLSYPCICQAYCHKQRQAIYVPPPAIVALMSESNSSSPLIASCKWRGVIRFTFKSLDAFPASSRTWRQMFLKQVTHIKWDHVHSLSYSLPKCTGGDKMAHNKEFLLWSSGFGSLQEQCSTEDMKCCNCTLNTSHFHAFSK